MATRSDPDLRRLLAHAGLGAVLGWAILAGLLVTDAAGLATLIAGSDLGSMAVALLALQFGGGFATFAAATALALPPADAVGGARQPWPERRLIQDSAASTIGSTRPAAIRTNSQSAAARGRLSNRTWSGGA